MKVGVQHIVRISALGAADKENLVAVSYKISYLANIFDHPDLWHREADNIVRESEVPYTILQPTSFLSNVAAFGGDTIKAQGVWYGSTGEGRVYFLPFPLLFFDHTFIGRMDRPHRYCGGGNSGVNGTGTRK